jgi:hypothetical protein
MIYNHSLGKGVRSKCLPQPNPIKIEMSKNSLLNDIYKRAKELFFKKKEGNMFLSDSSGVIIDLGVNWTKGKYYNENNFILSRHKLYVILDEKLNCCIIPD